MIATRTESSPAASATVAGGPAGAETGAAGAGEGEAPPSANEDAGAAGAGAGEVEAPPSADAGAGAAGEGEGEAPASANAGVGAAGAGEGEAPASAAADTVAPGSVGSEGAGKCQNRFAVYRGLRALRLDLNQLAILRRFSDIGFQIIEEGSACGHPLLGQLSAQRASEEIAQRPPWSA